jgi:serine/threonine protein kinase
MQGGPVSQPSAREVFDQALELPAGERAEFVRRACAGHGGLEQRVLGLLAAHDSVGEFLVATRVQTMMAPCPEAPSGERAGDLVGPYKLLSVIGEGGFGTVWLAERREPFVQRVAVKIIKPGMDSRGVIARFEQERQALAVMDHPNVAKVLDGGITPLGRPYFVMELVKGEPITVFCDRHRLTIRERLELFIPVCEAVQHAHMKGIIHRDIKPSNILVSTVESGGNSDVGSRISEPAKSGSPPAPTSDIRHPTSIRGAHVKVIDFGVAKAISHTLTDKTIFTEHGQIIGTPEYMSPEQAEMGAVDIDTRTDVYSLGVVLYELLAGVTPFDAAELRSKGYNEIQRIIREVEPPKPSARLTSLEVDAKGAPPGAASAPELARRRHSRVGELVRELRRELDWVPLMAMRKDRRERYQSALAMADDIGRYLRGQPLMAGPESFRYRTRKFVKRHRWGVGVGAAAFVLLAGFGAVSREQYVATAAAKKLADQSAEKAAREAYAANIAAAAANVELGNVKEAMRRLDQCEEARRGWEWRHLRWAADQSVGSRALANGVEGAVQALRIRDGDGSIIAATHNGVWQCSHDLNVVSGWTLPKSGVLDADRRVVSVSAQADRALVLSTMRYFIATSDQVMPLDLTTDGPPGLADGGSVQPGLNAAGDRCLIQRFAAPGPSQKVITLFDAISGRELARNIGDATGWFASGDRYVVLRDGRWYAHDRAGQLVAEGEAAGAGSLQGPDLFRPSDDGAIAVLAGPHFQWLGLVPGVDPLATRLVPGRVWSADGDVGQVAWADGRALRVRRRTVPDAMRLLGAEMEITAVCQDRSGAVVVTGEQTGVLRLWRTSEVCVDTSGRDSERAPDHVLGDPYGTHLRFFATGASRVVLLTDQERLDTVQMGPDFPPVLDTHSRDCLLVGKDGLRLSRVSSDAVTASLTGADLIHRMAEICTGPAGMSLPLIKGAAVYGAAGEWLINCHASPEKVTLIAFSHDLASARVVAECQASSDGVVATREGTPCVAFAARTSLCVWERSLDEPPHRLRLGHGVSALVFDKAGGRLAIGAVDGAVMMLSDLRTGAPSEFLGLHGQPVSSMAFTPKGDRLLTGSADGTVVVWDSSSGAPLASLSMGSPVLYLGFPRGEDRGMAILANGAVRWLGVRR